MSDSQPGWTKTAARGAASEGLPPDDFGEDECGSRTFRAVVSDEQFREYVRYGLIPEPVNGLYPLDTPRRLVCIHRMATEARSLPRRAIRLSATHHFWRMDPEKLRNTMVEVAPSIKSPKRKMRKVEVALAAWSRYLAQTPVLVAPYGLSRGWRPPPQGKWTETLTALDTASFADRAGAQYQVALNVLPVFVRSIIVDIGVKNTAFDLSAIPLEEQIVLLTVRDIAATISLREAAQQAERAREAEVDELRRKAGRKPAYEE